MDGRPQRKVSDYLLTSFGVRYLDTVTTAGMVLHLADETEQTPAILANLDHSVRNHESRHIAVVAHYDCIGNPVPEKVQREQITAAVERVKTIYPGPEVVGLWLDGHGIISRVWSK